MIRLFRSRAFRYCMVMLIAVGGLFFFAPAIQGHLFAKNFLPHSTCYLSNPKMIWLHVCSDSAIGLSYLAISSTLGYLVYRARREIPFHWMFLAFGLFIIACGFTHFMEVWTVWKPFYWLAGDVKLITAMASAVTAILLPPLVPKVIEMIRTVKKSEERRVKLETTHTELEQLYQRVKELDQLKSQFFANVSHELRTPLTLISAPAERLSLAPNLMPEQRRDLALIGRNAMLLLKHVNDLLDAAKVEAGRMTMHYQRVRLDQLVALLCANFESMAKDRKVLFTHAEEEITAEVDAEKVERALSNLLSNAFKFAPEDGQIECRARRSAGGVEVSVRDNGPGIPEDLRQTVFERFLQVEGGAARRHAGTGLGLAIAKDFVELHRGRISVSDAPGGGALFTMELPLQAPPGVPVGAGGDLPAAAAIVARALAAEIDRPGSAGNGIETLRDERRKPVVLVVEDNLELNRFITGVLAPDYTVISAFDGREGLEKALATVPDLILSDIMMPETTGEQLLHNVREQPALRDVPMVMLTAKADAELRVQLLRAGAQDYLTKPFPVEELRARVANYVSIQQARRTFQAELATQAVNIGDMAEEVVVRKQQAESALASLREAEQQLRTLNEALETRVRARTSELEAANKELQGFSDAVAHDIRAPLRAISGMAQILVAEAGPRVDDGSRQLLDRITSAASRLQTLTSDLLAYSSIARADLPLVRLALRPVIVQSVEALNADIAARQATVKVEDDFPEVPGNLSLLSQVFTNLVGNAIKYVPPERAPVVRVWCERGDGKVRLWVEDNGPGVPEEFHRTIFEPFQRLADSSRVPGTGIGLAIVERAVKRMNGSVGIESRESGGSRFWVELPE